MGSENVKNSILIVAGLVVIGLSLLADQIGVGAASEVFGYKQIGGTVIGAVLLAVGLINMAIGDVGDSILIIAGAVILGLSLLADQFGFGAASTVFGYKQIGGTVLGAILLAVGLAKKLKDSE
jgi:hypothetical protein